jgi:hypothetical protein
MDNSSEDDIITVWLWLQDIDRKVIEEVIVKEKGLDPEIFESVERFNGEIVSEVARQVETIVGAEEAHRIVMPEDMDEVERQVFRNLYDTLGFLEEFNEYDEAFFDRRISLVERAAMEKADEYMVAKREIVEREHSSRNDEFIRKYIGNKREIIFNSSFTSTLIVEATKAEIEGYAKINDVEDISLFVDHPVVSTMDPAWLQQINADDFVGTKSGLFNNGSGYKGTGVRIGVMEADSLYDHDSPLLSSIHNNGRLSKPILPGQTSEPVGLHATMVTSIIVGQAATSGGRVYEGVAPLATVYQVGSSNLYDSIENLIKPPFSVNVVNFSFGFVNSTQQYLDTDRVFDRISFNTGVTFVVSAGNLVRSMLPIPNLNWNSNNNITSPSRALNVIAVGNTETVSTNGTTQHNPPYAMHSTSSFRQNDFLPNKPDIAAPGANIFFEGMYSTPVQGTGTSFSAPVIAGVIAQMMQANPALVNIPTAVKSKLLLAADSSKISPTNNPSDLDCQHLREKSGAGFVDAVEAVNAAKNSLDVSFSINSTTATYTSSSHYFTAGSKIRAVMAYDKNNTRRISSQSDMDVIDFTLRQSNGTAIASSVSDRNNVRIIEHTIDVDGNYYFSVVPRQLISSIVNAHISVFPTMRISTSAQLDAVRNNLNGRYILMNDIPLAGTWTPIGTTSAPFIGTFYGGNHTISNLTSTTGGLFGTIGVGGKVTNVNVTGNIDTNNSTVGGIANINLGTINNCSFAGSIAGGSNTGGLVGMNIGTVSNSYSIGNVAGEFHVGGVLGLNSGTVSNCYATGVVSGSDYIGGVAGLNNGMGTVRDCAALNLNINHANQFVGRIGVSNNLNMFDNVAFNGIKLLKTAAMNTNAFGDSITAAWVTIDGTIGNRFTAAGGWTTENGKLPGFGKTLDLPPWFLPKEIRTASELNSIRNDISGGVYILMNNISLNGWNWQPIGTLPFSPFTGILNGNGKNITNLYSTNGGLFGTINGGVVKNLSVSGQINSSLSNVGLIAGHNNGGTISNCYSAGKITGSDNVGGIVGLNAGTVSRCYSIAEVHGTDYLGGIAGNNTDTITFCYALNESITGTSSNDNLGRVAGASSGYLGNLAFNGMPVSNSIGSIESIAGWNTTDGDDIKIRNLIAYDEMGWNFTSANGWASQAGKLPGFGTPVDLPPWLRSKAILTPEQLDAIRDDLEGVYHLGTNINLDGWIWEPIGTEEDPFEGILDGREYVITNLNINLPTQSGVGLFGYNRGELLNLTIENSVITGGECVGGVAGYNWGTISRCSFSGEVNGGECVGGIAGLNGNDISTSNSEGDVNGLDFIGGIAGCNLMFIKNCYSTSTVLGEYYVGGVVGYNGGNLLGMGGELYFDVSNCYSTGEVRGEDYVGGIVGYNDGHVYDCAALNQTVTSAGEDVGRVVGYNEGNIYNNIAFGDMEVIDTNGEKDPLIIGHDEIDGECANNSIFTNDGTIGGRFLSLPWTVQRGRLPSFGKTVNVPLWIPLFGDVDGDGVIDAADITLLRRYIAANDKTIFLQQNPRFNIANARVFGQTNAYPTAADVALLRQYIAGFDVTLGPQQGGMMMARGNKGLTFTIGEIIPDTNGYSYAEVEIRVENNPGIASISDMEIILNSAHLEWDMRSGSPFDITDSIFGAESFIFPGSPSMFGTDFAVINIAPGLENLFDVTDDGLLITLKIKVKDGAVPDGTSIMLTVIAVHNLENDAVEFGIENVMNW